MRIYLCAFIYAHWRRVLAARIGGSLPRCPAFYHQHFSSLCAAVTAAPWCCCLGLCGRDQTGPGGERNQSMMGTKTRVYTALPPLTLEGLVPADHCSRHLDRVLSLGVVRDLAQDRYAAGVGRPRVNPVDFL